MFQLRHIRHTFCSTSTGAGAHSTYCKKPKSVPHLSAWKFRHNTSSTLATRAQLPSHHRRRSKRTTLHSPAWPKLVTGKYMLNMIPKPSSNTNKFSVLHVVLRIQTVTTRNKPASLHRQKNASKMQSIALILLSPFHQVSHYLKTMLPKRL